MDIEKLTKITVDGQPCIALVRKLTERECGRLMDVDEADITTMLNSGISRSAAYKLYGNSIVVNVLFHLMRKAFIPGERGNESQQMSLFDLTNDLPTEEYNHEHPLRVFTLCSGYGSQELALERLKQTFPPFDYKIVGWSEFDPETPDKPLDEQPAVKAYKALHPEAADLNYGDMTKIDWENTPDFDLLFYSTPCQSISQAGLQHGFTEGSGTRSSIIWNVRDALRIKKPKFACLENVAAMVTEKFLPMFNLWRDEVTRLGYDNFAQLLNSREYNVPQNRNRIFLWSQYCPEHNSNYNFPPKMPLEKKLRDVLEGVVDTKYYLNPEKVQQFVADNIETIEKYAKEDDGEIEPLPDHLRKWLEEYEEKEATIEE